MNLKRFIIAITFALLQSFVLLAQIPEEFVTSCAFDSCQKYFDYDPKSLAPCNTVSSSERRFDDLFIPSTSRANTAIKINFIFVQRNDGSGNFQENNQEHDVLFEDIIDILNDTYANLVNTTDPNCNIGTHTFVPDTKIRFEANKIYIRDSYAWDNGGGNLCPGSNWYLNYLDNLIVADPNYERGINIYFTEDSTNYFDLVVNQTTTNYNGSLQDCSEYPSFSDFSKSSRIHFPDKYSKYWWMKNICPSIYNEPWDPVIRGWYLNLGRGIAHEIGHSLWLFHSCSYYTTNGCPVALMNQSGSTVRNYIPPPEVGRMHASIALSNIRTFIEEEYDPTPLSVSSIVNFDVNTKLQQDIHIENGGYVTINCDFSLLNEASIMIKNGGELEIAENCILVNNDGSAFDFEIIVQNGGTLTINNSNILTGDNGRIILEDGSTLNCIGSNTINGSGYIYLNSDLNALPGASINFIGSNRYIKMLEVNSDILFDSDFNNVTFKDGKIVMNNSDSRIYLSIGIGNVLIDNVIVTSSAGINNDHRGIHIREGITTSIKNSILEYGNYGIQTINHSIDPLFEIENCEFRNCTYGLWAWNGCYDISDSKFENNSSRGIFIQSADNPSYISDNIIKYQNGYNDYGIYYEGSSTASINLRRNIISNNYDGNFISGPFNATFSCNTIANNVSKGIYIYNKVNLYLTSESGYLGGTNDLHGNRYAVYASGSSTSNKYNKFYLHYGANDLRSDYKCMYGYFYGFTSGYINAYDNYWKTGGGAPVNGTNYTLYGSSGSLYLRDYSANSSFSPCFNPELPGDLIPMAVKDEFIESFDFRTINTSLGEYPLNEAIDLSLIDYGKEDEDIGKTFVKLCDILSLSLLNLNEGEKWYVDYAYNILKDLTGKISYQSSRKNINIPWQELVKNVIKSRLLDIGEDNYNEWFNYNIDLVHTLAQGGFYDDAFEILNNLKYKAEEDDKCYLKELTCQLKIDEKIHQKNLKEDIDELLSKCDKCDDMKKSGQIDVNEKDIIEEVSLFNLAVFPNPIKNNSIIKAEIPEDLIKSKLEIINYIGEIVKSYELSKGENIFEIGNSNINPGLYMVVLKNNSQILAQTKIIVLD